MKYFSLREEKFMFSGAYKHLGLTQEGQEGWGLTLASNTAEQG